ncbi:MAG: RrF2 family transcriptional regulator [Flavobacteriales bacterium]
MLSKKAQYAFQALTFLMEKKDEGPVLISSIAAEKDISLKFLEQILLEMKKGGILASKKGKGGGYYLNKAPNEIPLAKVIRLIDGPIAMLPCVSLNYYEKCDNCDESVCGINRIMKEVRDATLKVLENKSLEDIAKTS